MNGTASRALPLEIAVGEGGHAHAGGWHLLDLQLDAAGTVAGRLYLLVDYAAASPDGDECVVLPLPDASGRVRALVRLHTDACRLRLVSMQRFAAVLAARIELRRKGKVAALALMVRHASQLGRARTGWRLLRRCLAEMLRAGPRAAGDLTYATYAGLCAGSKGDYREWVERYDATPGPGNARLRARVQQLAATPLVSILLPVYAPPERWLRACLDSVLAQAYPHWELCIADDGSPAPHVRRVIEGYMRRDARIRVVWRPHNGHICHASNSALALARGDWVALLDHDDALAPHALLEMVEAANAHPRWRMLYSDEDKIDEAGNRFDPYFKPDFNYALLLGQNCISHFGMYAADLVRAIGGFQPGLEGSQDWDLALRCVEQLQPDQIGHVPRVLYHWRAIPGSTARSHADKAYASDAALRAVQAHLDRTGQPARAGIAEPGRIRVHRELPQPVPAVSLIVPTRDRVDLLRTCLRGLLERTEYPALEVLVVDNQSTDPQALAYLDAIAGDPRVRVLRFDAPFNYSAINNVAARHASGQVLGLINNDIEVIEPGWLREMVAEAVVPTVGAVGALLLYPDGRLQHAGVLLGLNGVAGHPHAGRSRQTPGQMGRLRLVQELSAVTGACLLLRRQVFEVVGGLDEALPVAFNDVDLCLRIRAAGYRNLWTPHAALVHAESATRGHDGTPEKRARLARDAAFMQARWGAVLQSDPAYNPNLDLQGNGFELAFPPRAPGAAVQPG
ncbi:glycosyltransferase family 2 protein [Thermomonas paludicola]|uniref:glycosyltransferase family 2 protein n=1 Tax=Thermomonas paludicola TaxID=2884874 RepID=UPI0021151BD3|nr:glycosyltransferase family 2 protein [Thermomonas paludicola]